MRCRETSLIILPLEDGDGRQVVRRTKMICPQITSPYQTTNQISYRALECEKAQEGATSHVEDRPAAPMVVITPQVILSLHQLLSNRFKDVENPPFADVALHDDEGITDKEKKSGPADIGSHLAYHLAGQVCCILNCHADSPHLLLRNRSMKVPKHKPGAFLIFMVIWT